MVIIFLTCSSSNFPDCWSGLYYYRQPFRLLVSDATFVTPFLSLLSWPYFNQPRFPFQGDFNTNSSRNLKRHRPAALKIRRSTPVHSGIKKRLCRRSVLHLKLRYPQLSLSPVTRSESGLINSSPSPVSFSSQSFFSLTRQLLSVDCFAAHVTAEKLCRRLLCHRLLGCIGGRTPRCAVTGASGRLSFL